MTSGAPQGPGELPAFYSEALSASGSQAAPAANTVLATIHGSDLRPGIWDVSVQMFSTVGEGVNSANGKLMLGSRTLMTGIATTQCCPPPPMTHFRLPVESTITDNLTLGTAGAANAGTIFALLVAHRIATYPLEEELRARESARREARTVALLEQEVTGVAQAS